MHVLRQVDVQPVPSLARKSLDFSTRARLVGIRGISFELGRNAVRTVHDIITREQIACDVTPEGGLELAHKPNRLTEMEARATQMNKLFGLGTELLSKAELERVLARRRRTSRSVRLPTKRASRNRLSAV